MKSVRFHLWLFALSACSHLPLPYRAHDLARDSQRIPERALVHYLAQKDAEPGVCRLAGDGEHLARFDVDVAEALLDGVVSDRLEMAIVKECLLRVVPSLPVENAAAVLERLVERAAKLVRKGSAEARVERELEVLHDVVALRPSEVKLPATVLQRLVARMRDALERGSSMGRCRQLGDELLEAFEVEQGLWHRAPVNDAVLAGLEDDGVLHRLALRLPNPEQRLAARRRLVAVRLDASPFASAVDRAAVIERVVMTGRNAIEPANGAAMKGSFTGPTLSLLVRQNVPERFAALLPATGTAQAPSLLPAVDLHDVLRVDVAGLPGSITVCQSPERLRPEPCIEASRLETRNPLARIAEDGLLRLSEDLDPKQLLGLVDQPEGLHLSLVYGDQVLTSVVLPVRFETPAPVVVQGAIGGRAPNLKVRAEKRGGRLVFSVQPLGTGPRELLVVTELRDAHSLRIVSRGGIGQSGSDGSRGRNGSAGTRGMSAICPYSSGGAGGQGSSGSSGGNGEAGGPGGDGGDVEAVLSCSGPECGALLEVVKAVVRSEGGAGGPGGRGGAGGQGGAGGDGGSGTSCTRDGRSTYLSGGMSGSRGSDGMRGSDGPSGSPGSAGKVTVRVMKPGS